MAFTLRVPIWLLILPFLAQGVVSLKISFVNECEIPVWPTTAPNDNIPPLQPPFTGFILKTGKSKTITLPNGWEGLVWGRTHCSVALDNKFICGTGDCASGTIECASATAAPPVTFVEFTFHLDTGSYSFSLSLMYGYNVAMRVSPTGRLGENCTDIECKMDLDKSCPKLLKVSYSDEVVACKSACGVFGHQDYCCIGGNNTHDTCTQSDYSKQFKKACPRAYTYYDDVNNIFPCPGADYLVTFCPRITNSGKPQIPAAPTNKVDNVTKENAALEKHRHKHRRKHSHLVIIGSCIGALVGLVLAGVVIIFICKSACCNNNQTVNNYFHGPVNMEMANHQNHTVNH